MDIDALRTELLTPHPVTGAYNADAKLAAAQLNAIDRTRLRAVSMGELREWAAVGARAFKIHRGIVDVGLTDQPRNLCLILDKLLGTDDGFLDPSNSAHVTLIGELISAGVLTTADRAALATKATDNISRADELGLGKVKPGHVEEARR